MTMHVGACLTEGVSDRELTTEELRLPKSEAECLFPLYKATYTYPSITQKAALQKFYKSMTCGHTQ